MKFHINKQNEVTAHEQLREQIIFHIGSGELAIGQQMPSVRALARQVGISVNTVSRVYSELVRGGWLVERAGAHHMVLERKNPANLLLPGTGLDDLMDRIIRLAQASGYSMQQLADRLHDRLMDQPPDHFLIVEPDPGMGEIMREEIRKAIGYAPPACGLQRLQHHPAFGIGALLISPAYTVDKLGQHVADSSDVLPVSYSPMDGILLAISRLSQPSMLGWVSVSGAGLKTMSSMAAPMCGGRHTNHLFLVERFDPEHLDQVRFRRYGLAEYRPIDILKPDRGESESSSSAPHSALDHGDPDFVTIADLSCMDLLFCDSIAFALIDHPQKVHYQLLSGDSLKSIKACALNFSQPEDPDSKEPLKEPSKEPLMNKFRPVKRTGPAMP